MLLKTTDKFVSRKDHLLLFAFVSVVFVIKSYRTLLIINTTDPVIADGNFTPWDNLNY